MVSIPQIIAHKLPLVGWKANGMYNFWVWSPGVGLIKVQCISLLSAKPWEMREKRRAEGGGLTNFNCSCKMLLLAHADFQRPATMAAK